MKSCCQATETDSKCKRITDGKEFDLPRKYSKKRCMGKMQQQLIQQKWLHLQKS